MDWASFAEGFASGLGTIFVLTVVLGVRAMLRDRARIRHGGLYPDDLDPRDP